jgi:Mn2+/Fe2+ NRAMP family transporter
MIIIGALVVLIPGAALTLLAQIPNIINGVLLPPLLLIMLLIINDRRVMGRYVNGPVANVASWVTVGFVILLTILLLLTNLAPSLFGK